MKVIKPTANSIITRVFENSGKLRLSISSLVMASLSNTRESTKLMSEAELWRFWATRVESNRPLEEGIMRTRSEYLVSGFAYPHQNTKSSCAVSAQVGSMKKQLIVHGERLWQAGSLSKSKDFESISLDWSNAFGGHDIAVNPLGKGWVSLNSDQVAPNFAPNIEHPSFPVVSSKEKYQPQSFGPIDQTWPQRAQYAGTYDDRWLKNDFPAVAFNTDWRFFNIAPDDQQQDEAFQGDERYVFHNMHPEIIELQGQLPGIRTRTFATLRTSNGDKFKEIPMRLNTLWFFPDAERVIQIYQGVSEIAEDDGADVLNLMTAIEYLDKPRSTAHYSEVLEKRLDKKNGAVEFLRESDLTPSDLVVNTFEFMPYENKVLERSQRRAKAENVAARKIVSAHNLDPDAGYAPAYKSPELPVIKTIDDIFRLELEMDATSSRLKLDAEKNRAEILSKAQALFTNQKLDYSTVERLTSGIDNRGPPKAQSKELFGSVSRLISEGKLAGLDMSKEEDSILDQKTQDRWNDNDKKQLVSYRNLAHFQIPANRLTTEASKVIRKKVIENYAKNGSFKNWDLTGADLSGLDLHGANFDGALMESVNLTGTNLSDAKLENTVLAHSILVSTDCQSANFSGANLGSSKIEKSNFTKANLTKAIFVKTHLIDVCWRDARLDNVDLDEAIFSGLDLTGATSESMITFFKRDLKTCNFRLTKFKQCTFIECDIFGVNFSNATLGKVAFIKCLMDKTVLSGINIKSGCFAQNCSLLASNFAFANLCSVNFRGSFLTDAIFENAILKGSDFSECDLSRANFCFADLFQARFVRADLTGVMFNSANLFETVFQHAKLDATSYSNANLFQSDFARVKLSSDANFEGALTTRMRTYPRHKPQLTSQ